jgi:hypothetical protein
MGPTKAKVWLVSSENELVHFCLKSKAIANKSPMVNAIIGAPRKLIQSLTA